MKARGVLPMLATLVAVMTVIALAPVALAQEPPQPQDFFGIVLSVDETSLVVSTAEGDVQVLTSENTKIELPLKGDAELADLAEGDWLSMDYDLAAASAASGVSQYELLTGLAQRFARG